LRLRRRAGAADALIAAGLLHDVGHFTGTVTGRELVAGTGNMHSETGASWLFQWFGQEVTEPVFAPECPQRGAGGSAVRMRQWSRARARPG
jgi:predicted HD phosphohydrolase